MDAESKATGAYGEVAIDGSFFSKPTFAEHAIPSSAPRIAQR